MEEKKIIEIIKFTDQDDLNTVQRYGVTGFPTFLLRYGEQEVLMRGYQDFDSIKSGIKALAGDAIKDVTPEKSDDKVLEFIRKHGRVAPVEIQASFDYSHKEVQAIVNSMKEKNLIHIMPAGNGVFITPFNIVKT